MIAEHDRCWPLHRPNHEGGWNRLFFCCFLFFFPHVFWVSLFKFFVGSVWSSDLRPPELGMDLTKRQRARAAVVVVVVVALFYCSPFPFFFLLSFWLSRPSRFLFCFSPSPACVIGVFFFFFLFQSVMPSTDSSCCGDSNTATFSLALAGVATLFLCPAVCHSSFSGTPTEWIKQIKMCIRIRTCSTTDKRNGQKFLTFE